MKRCTSQLTQVGAPRRGLVRSHAVTWVPVLAALAWLAGCVVPADSSPNGQIEATQQGIAGGARPTDGQFPATVFWDAGRGPSGPRYCSGSRVGKHAILTAAHCVAWGEMTPGTSVDVSNATNTKAAGAVFSKVVLRQAHVHPAMAAAIAGGLTRAEFEVAEAFKRVLPDLAVLEFEATGVDVMPGIERVEFDAADVAEGDTITLSGYGCVDLNTKADGRQSFGSTRVVGPAGAKAPSSVAGLLGSAPVDLSDEAVFSKASTGYFYNVAGGVLGTKGPLTCVGDSGGPVYRAGKVVGVNSFRFALPDPLPNGTTGLLWGVGLMPRLSDGGGFKSATWLAGILAASDIRTGVVAPGDAGTPTPGPASAPSAAAASGCAIGTSRGGPRDPASAFAPGFLVLAALLVTVRSRRH